MPSVLPRSSVPRNRFFSHLPSFIARSAAGTDARQRQHQRAGVLGDADAVGAGRVDDEDAARAGGGDVDVVDAGAGARDDPEPRRGVEQRARRPSWRCGRAARRRRRDRRRARRACARSARRRPAGFGAQQFQRRGRQIVGDDDFHGIMCGWCVVVDELSWSLGVDDRRLRSTVVSIIRRFWSRRVGADALALPWCKPLKHSNCASQRRKRDAFSTEFSTAFAEIFRGRQVT